MVRRLDYLSVHISVELEVVLFGHVLLWLTYVLYVLSYPETEREGGREEERGRERERKRE